MKFVVNEDRNESEAKKTLFWKTLAIPPPQDPRQLHASALLLIYQLSLNNSKQGLCSYELEQRRRGRRKGRLQFLLFSSWRC